MSLTFGVTFQDEFNKFKTLHNLKDFAASVIPFVQFVRNCLTQENHPYVPAIRNWKVKLFNEDQHMLYPHQIQALQGCLNRIVLDEKIHTGYCFMPTSAGKGHILMTLAGLAIGDFTVFKIVSDTMPDAWNDSQSLLPLLICLGLEYSKLVQKSEVPRTQILVHDTGILEQLKNDCYNLLGQTLASNVEFHSVQALRNEARRENLKYVIIDECHWGNATEEKTIQSSLIRDVSASGGKAFGFTASPYTSGKFQDTWSENKVSGDLDFNYYLDNGILYPVTLREVNLQNARVGFDEDGEEIDLTEKSQVIDFMADFIKTTVSDPLDGPAICYFNPAVIPDIVQALIERRPDFKEKVKVLSSDSAAFAEKCEERFGNRILATDEDIKKLKAGEKLFIISRQKLLVGLNAPYLRYCFISPTNSKITIMQAIGRLMRPIDKEKVPKKTAVLFLASLSGKKLDITSGEDSSGAQATDKETVSPIDYDDHDDPKSRYTTTSMTLSEAYDLPIPVFYKTEVGFRDFINQNRVNDGNSVEILGRSSIDPESLEANDWLEKKREVEGLRRMILAQYKRVIVERDSRVVNGKKLWCCRGKELIGSEGCERSQLEVNIEIHHKPPFTFHQLYRRLGRDGVLAWHASQSNLEHLVSLCVICHDKAHEHTDKELKDAS